jgi:hypothetical protein
MAQSLEELLSAETSRRNTDLIAGIVLSSRDVFDELMKIYLRDEEPVSRRAVWVADVVTEKKPDWLLPWIETMTEALPSFTHDGMKRQTLRMLMRSPLPKKNLGVLMNICFDWLTSPKEAVAAKVYAMEILYRMSELEHDLKKELSETIEWRMEEETRGFQSKGRKILQKINKELRDLQSYSTI